MGSLCAALFKKIRDAEYGTGLQGRFTAALVQYGFVDEDDDTKPIDPALRSNLQDMLDNEKSVRDFWEKANPKKRRTWRAARSIFRNWKLSLKPKDQPAAPKIKRGVVRAQPLTAEEIAARSALRPTPEAMQAKAKAEAEAERKRLDAKETDVAALSETKRRLEFEIEGLRGEKADLTEEIGKLKAPKRETPTACSFCGRDKAKVEVLVASGMTKAAICNECIEQARSSVSAKRSNLTRAKRKAKANPFKQVEDNINTALGNLMKGAPGKPPKKGPR